MYANHHTVKILDAIVTDDLSDIFIVMNYVCSDLAKVLKQEKTGID